MKTIILLSLVLLSSCATNELYSFKYIKRSEVGAEYTVPQTTASKKDIFEEYRWSTLIFISNNYGGYNHLELPESFCEKSDVLRNVKLSTKARGTPLIWFDNTWTFEGDCHE